MPSFEEVLDSSYVDLLEGARILGVHSVTFRRLIKKQKELKGEVMFYRGKYFINREAILRFKEIYNPRTRTKVDENEIGEESD